MGSGLTTRRYSSQQSAGGSPLSGAEFPQSPWSKIGAEPAQHVLQRVGMVNLPVFPSSVAAEAPSPARRGISGTSALSMVSAFATRGWRCISAVTMAKAPFARAPMVDRILHSRSLTSSTPSAIGFQMTDFRRKLFLQEADREPSVLFDTAGLSCLYPFATARAQHCNGFLRRVNAVASGFAACAAAIEVGRRLSAAFARKHARAADVSN